MEPSTFDDQIFGDFAGPLSPLGGKAHSVQLMLGGGSGSNSAPGGEHGSPNSSGSTGHSNDLCQQQQPQQHQRLPEVHSLLPGGAPKLADHYKTLDYASAKIIDYKLEAYGSPTAKYDYLVGATSSPVGSLSPTKQLLDYGHGKQMDYSVVNNNGGKQHQQHVVVTHGDYSTHSPPASMMVHQQQQQQLLHQPGQSHLHMQTSAGNKLNDYEPHHHMQIFHHSHHQQHQHHQQQHQHQQPTQTIDMASGVGGGNCGSNSSNASNSSVDMNGMKKKADELSCSSTTNAATNLASSGVATTADANGSAAAGKKNDKKKGDPNGAKKKKTRYVGARNYVQVKINLEDVLNVLMIAIGLLCVTDESVVWKI